MEQTSPKPFVFVLMPFSDEFRDIYEVGIKAACSESGAHCERLDEQIYTENMLTRIYNQIDKADIIIADMTGRNANVFYETGYAHALNKQVILLTQNPSDIPFDLKHYPHVVYEGSGKIASLKSQLKPRIRWFIDNPKSSLSNVDINLQFFVNAKEVVDNPVINALLRQHPIENTDEYHETTALTIDIHNSSSKVLNPDSYNLAIIVPDIFGAYARTFEDSNSSKFRSVTKLPDGCHIYHVRKLDTMFPKSWSTLDVFLTTTRGKRSLVNSFEIVIRLFTEVGPKDYPFTVKANTTISANS